MSILQNLLNAGIPVVSANEETGEVIFQSGITLEQRSMASDIAFEFYATPEQKIEREAKSQYAEFQKPVKAPDFIVATPPIKDDPELALDDAIAETEKGAGSDKSIYIILGGLAKYLKAKRSKLK